jgi:hypothetical protein
MAQNPWAPWLSNWGVDQASSNHQPLSGDVSQWLRIFSPTVTVNGRGDPDLEGEIVRDVATYGAQLGPLTALVLALAEGKEVPADALTKLREICVEIETKKDHYRLGALGRARNSLAELAEADPAGLAKLLAEFGENGPT